MEQLTARFIQHFRDHVSATDCLLIRLNFSLVSEAVGCHLLYLPRLELPLPLHASPLNMKPFMYITCLLYERSQTNMWRGAARVNSRPNGKAQPLSIPQVNQ